ncbi:acetolactate synthase small subunit, partial [Treponema endosymbiont of Eucomonympha sp.]|uniref:acetolactate synthase small subunit n=1 Tax=Treponema endosymbiont of Eucomonympha sp. TaxID=1580831 RepID=UPI000A71D19F
MNQQASNGETQRYVLAVLVDNHAGVLSRVSGLFSRRGFNIDSLTVGETHRSTQSRLTIVVSGAEHVLEQMTKPLADMAQ